MAAEIILELKAGKPISVIKQQIIDKFDVDASTLEKDWDDFHAQLREANLLS